MAHQAHNIPWTVLASNLDWRLSNRCKVDASDLHLRFRPDQGKKLTYFTRAFARNIHSHADVAPDYAPATDNGVPDRDETVLDDEVTRRIAPAVLRSLNVDLMSLPEERKMSAFLRKHRETVCFEFHLKNKESFFNLEIFKTLIMCGEMETVLRICSHKDVDLKSWWKQQECQCYPFVMGWDQISALALDSYIILNVIQSFPEMLGPGQKDYRRLRSYQSLVWRATSMSESDAPKYPHRQFYGIKDGQFRSVSIFEKSKRWSHLKERFGKNVQPFGHLPYEEFLTVQAPSDYVPLSSDVAETRLILCEKGLPMEISDQIVDLSSSGERRRLPIPHEPFHPDNAAELHKYLTYCWQLIVRSEIVGRALGMQIDWETQVGLALVRLFNCECGSMAKSRIYEWSGGDDDASIFFT